MMIDWFSGAGYQAAATIAGITLGVCQLSVDYETQPETMSGVVCLEGRLSEDVAVLPKSGEGLFKVASGTGSLGVYFSPLFALQVEGSLWGVSRFNGGENGWNLLPNSPSGVERRRNHLVVRIGSPGLHRLHVTLGNQRLPFGIDLNPGDDLWQLTEDRIFWGDELRSAVVTLDNQVDFQTEIGVGFRSNAIGIDEGVGTTDEHFESSLRMIHDLSFFERARLILSASGTEKRPRYGFGFLTKSKQGDVTQVEIARTTWSDSRYDAGFRRLFRFAFEAANRRWWFLYDEDRLRTQTVALGYRHFFSINDSLRYEPIALRFSLGSVRSFSSDIDSRLAISSGLEASF